MAANGYPNVFSSTPDYLIGLIDGQEVQVPIGSSPGSPAKNGAKILTTAGVNDLLGVVGGLAPNAPGAAAANYAAWQAALASSGGVQVPGGLGTVWMQGTGLMLDDTHLDVGGGTTLMWAAGRSQPCLMNKYAGLLGSAALLSRSNNVATWVESNTWRSVGDQLLLQAIGMADTSFNGLVSVASVSASGFTFASTGSNTTAAGTLQRDFYNIIPIRRTIQPSQLNAIGGGYVDVLDPGHTFRSGQWIFIGSTSANPFAPGVVRITRTSANFWSYYAPGATGTSAGPVLLNWGSNIKITGDGKIDGNRLGTVIDNADCAIRACTTHFGCVTGVTINAAIGGSQMRGVNVFNCADVVFDHNSRNFDSLVNVQFDGGGENLIIDQTIRSESSGDYDYPQPVTITSAVGNGSLVTVNTATPHGLQNQTTIATSGFTPSGFNAGLVQIVVTGPSSFTYPASVSGSASVIGTYKVGQQADDQIAFCGTPYSSVNYIYNNTVSPYGLQTYSGIDARNVNCTTALNGVKFCASGACPFLGTNRVGKIFARMGDPFNALPFGAAVRFFDDTTITGTTADTIQVDGPIEWIGPSASATTAALVEVQGTGSVKLLSIKGLDSQVGNFSAVTVTGATIQKLKIDAGHYVPLGASMPNISITGGTQWDIEISGSRVTTSSSAAFFYVSGGTQNAITLNGMTLDDNGTLGELIDWASTSFPGRLTFRGIRQNNIGANVPLSILTFDAAAALGGTVITFDDCDLYMPTVINANTQPSGSATVVLSGSFKWNATGGGNMLNVGGGAWTVMAAPGAVVQADRLFGFSGTATYRVHSNSPFVQANMNSGNYVGAQMAPVNGDMIWNDNAGVLAIGPVVRRVGAWTAL